MRCLTIAGNSRSHRSPVTGSHRALTAAACLFLIGASLWAAPEDGGADFDGKQAFKFLRAQCDLGPRPPGSRAHRLCRDWITKTCREFDLETTHQPFRAYIPLIKRSSRLTNVIALHQPDNPRKIMLSAHWDTRPIADRDPDGTRRSRPIVGANDGASGVAVLLELARVFQKQPPKVGVVFTFFDGEDSGTAGDNGFCLGSKFLAAHLRPQWDFEKGVNLDMVGDRDLSIPIEINSWEKARNLALELWNLAMPMYPETFKKDRIHRVDDDHKPFLDRGKPYVNVIDFDYPYWHTEGDVPEHCSALSLAKVGWVLLEWLKTVK